MIMIDPIAALEAVNKAVKMVKMASQTASDVSQLGPLLGNYFDAKQTAIKAAKQAKKKGGSNLGAALQIEMALKAQADFEKQIEGLFFSSNNIDIWHQIKQRERDMNRADKIEAERQERLRKEYRELGIAMAISAVLLGALGWLLIKVLF